MKKKKIIKIICLILLIVSYLILSLFFIRQINPREIDDISPEIECSKKLINNVDVLWVIPKFQNKSISENKEWCNYILSLNKKIGMHGITHEYNEFKTDRNQEYIQEGIKIFEECFGFRPIMFKPPQIAINKNNKKLIRNNKMELKSYFNQLTRKVYHCNDTGKFKNKFNDIF
ncbi:MAG: DUF2334 domain-containing protein [Candidatus Pacearchaeota archaeon]